MLRQTPSGPDGTSKPEENEANSSACENAVGPGNKDAQMPINRSGMKGIITTRHLVTQAPTIIHEFGIATYCRCVAAVLLGRRKVTFLECVMRDGRSD